MSAAILKPHPRHAGYLVSSAGSVKSLYTRAGTIDPARAHDLAPERDRRGYKRVRIRVARGRYEHLFVHVLVLETFVGGRLPGMVARHLDGNNQNNAVENLAWGTPAENVDDRHRHGGYRKPTCTAGHVFDEANTYVHKSGRQCRACRRARRALEKVAAGA